MPLVRRKPGSFRIDNVIVDVPFEARDDPTRPSFWNLLMDNNSYKAALDKLQEISPEALEIVPCIVELDEAKNKAEEEKILRAWRAIARALAKFAQQFGRYTAEFKSEAFENLKEAVSEARELWSDYECSRRRGKKANSKKS